MLMVIRSDMTVSPCVMFLQIFHNELKDMEREVCFIDIACDEVPERYYKESEVSGPREGLPNIFLY